MLLLASLCSGMLTACSPFSEEANAMPQSELQTHPGQMSDAYGGSGSRSTAIAMPESPSTQQTKRLQVRPGDNISTILDQLGLAPGELHELLRVGNQAAELRRVFPGQWVEIGVHEDGTLRTLKIERDAANLIEWVRPAGQQSFQLNVKKIEPQVRIEHASETIVNNLFVAGQRGGLGDEIILRLARIFRWDIDFVLDVRAGDTFEVLYESEYLNGKFHRYGDILATRFTNRGKRYTAIRFIQENGEKAYFSPDGQNLRGAFLRAPVDFTRVSSGFSHKRVHPLFNRVRAHLGVDYAAPSGTPVKAAGRGTVQTVAYKPSSGNYIEIQHADGIETRYLHLSRFARGIKAGTRVSQGDVIGYVGSTGWATGPHLHYEYIENGRHMDPRKVAVVRDSAITEAEMTLFLAQTQPLHDHLNSFDSKFSVIGAN